MLEKYGGLESLVDRYAEKLYRYSLTNPTKFKTYKRHDITIQNWIDKDLEQTTIIDSDPMEGHWQKNQALVTALKLQLPRCSGLTFYYKNYTLRDKNNSDVDIYARIDHADFKRYMEKKYGVKFDE